MHLSTPPSSAYTKDNPLPAKLLENRVLNKDGSGKDTRHLVIDIAGSGLTYQVGDSLGIYPANRPQLVDEVIELLGATGNEPVQPARATAAISLREALTSKLSLNGPTKKILETLALKATTPKEKGRLESLLAPEAAELREAFLGEREYIDLLEEFPGIRLTPQELVDHLRRLMPRLYSIASSPLRHPGEVHLTVAPVRYESNGRRRYGVCSTFLADRVTRRKTPIPVFVATSHFKLPEDLARDVIMVGPGTGVAPFRAFMQERVATAARGRNWLFFGDQHQATDYLYGDEWKALLAEGKMARVDLAFSRDQAQKIYVQDRMRENAAEFWAWIQGGAHLYVCGDAHRMAKDVDLVLHQIIEQQGGLEPAAAAEYVKQMKRDKRYQRDVY
ncbi:Sulfite reductase [NADPH] flavoprotein alpha-component [Lacunisphaera limnophila]|uniref:assimilatory sulfite reductase (NADPH) n=2 Tax=Lacunisphaera limnophila TaxID=1838286 RepID=A0A1D8AWB0_9BACT|nr:Sulfite reductase [NADPH] flavoprotein alpha-component [Lacunisphaera limnophila]